MVCKPRVPRAGHGLAGCPNHVGGNSENTHTRGLEVELGNSAADTVLTRLPVLPLLMSVHLQPSLSRPASAAHWSLCSLVRGLPMGPSERLLCLLSPLRTARLTIVVGGFGNGQGVRFDLVLFLLLVEIKIP